MSDELMERYHNKTLTLDDVIDNIELFENIPVEQYMIYNYDFNYLSRSFDITSFHYIIKNHPKLIKHLVNNGEVHNFITYLNKENNTLGGFNEAVKQYFLENYANSINYNFRESIDGVIHYNIPEWLTSMNFLVKEDIQSYEELINYNQQTLILNENQQKIIRMLGIENIKRLEEETGFFSHKQYPYSKELELFDLITSYFAIRFPLNNKRDSLKFKDGSLSYEEFRSEFAKMLDIMRASNAFQDYPNYDFIEGKFRSDYPEIFISKDAPEELRDAFYQNKLSFWYLYNHQDYFEYLQDKNLDNTILSNMYLRSYGAYTIDGKSLPMDIPFIPEYTKRYGNQALFDLIGKYSGLLEDIAVLNLHDEIDNKEVIDKQLREAIYNKIINRKVGYQHLANVPEFTSEYPDIFINFDEIDDSKILGLQHYLRNAFYNRQLKFEDIRTIPFLKEVLKDKNLFVPFGEYDRKDGISRNSNKINDLELLKYLSNEEFLTLCLKYGKYMDGYSKLLSNYTEVRDGKLYRINTGNLANFKEMDHVLEDLIYDSIIMGVTSYDEDAPSFLHEMAPILFLDNDAPQELKDYFYGKKNAFTFEVLSKHKEWLPYLKDKSVDIAMVRESNHRYQIQRYFQVFDYDIALKLGINRPETVTKMINANQIDIMKDWFDKTGGRFIPDVVIMQNFPITEADKFLSSGVNWSNLMRIKNFASNIDSREAMLKLAYSFGAFDGDNRGYKKVYELLTEIPRHISSNHEYLMDIINQSIRNDNSVNPNYWVDELQTALNKAGLDINLRQDGFNKIYRKNEDGSYTLVINQQNAKEACNIIHVVLQNFRDLELPMLTPTMAHKLFGGFDLKYDKDFREFLLDNIDTILTNPEYGSYIASIQKRFSEIKAVNSNRKLTLDLAISYVKDNKYVDVEVGNDKVAQVSAIAGYSQQDFRTLQQIYNHGKQRTFSSIPRIENATEKYKYELLRLDDPLAMAIGTLTDCCQELGNAAEVCMEHSMTSSHGRVFVVRDNLGNIVAQSWVWRNKDTICFDNIEIPDKAFDRADKNNLSREEFSDEVYEIYKKAAHELISLDEKKYKELLDKGMISQEEYDTLRLGKVTVGLGYNDIASSLKRHAKHDKESISHPLPYNPPVELSHGMYDSDSMTQYVLEERENREKSNYETLPVYHDEYVVYDDNNMTEKDVLMLEKLEIKTKGNANNLDTAVLEYGKQDRLVSEIAYNMDLSPDKTKIVMNPNFAIIYDEIRDNKVRLGSIFFNTEVEDNSEIINIEQDVAMQIRLALEQISRGREIDITLLDKKQKEMYEKAIALSDKNDIDWGIKHAKNDIGWGVRLGR